MTNLDYNQRMLCFVFGLCLLPSFVVPTPETSFQPVHEWKQLEFEYQSEAARQADIASGAWIPSIPAPIDVDIHYSKTTRSNRMFVTIPRFQAGIPMTFGTVTNQTRDGNRIIRPYPSWDWQKNVTGCPPNRIVSVYRIYIDECERLWVMDAGKLVEDQICPPQLLAFDLKTDQLVVKHELSSTEYQDRSIFVTPTVDIRDGRCNEAFVYMADCQVYSIVVYDLSRRTSWLVTDKTMYPFPNFGTYRIAGNSFELMDGILGMALSPYRPNEDRRLYFHAMSSGTENFVYTGFLRNQSRFQGNSGSSPEIFNVYRGQRSTQAAAEATDANGIMFFGLMSDITINCWNTRTEYGPHNIHAVASNRKTLQFASGIKVIQNKKNVQELWVLTSRFQLVANGLIDTNVTNFRILAGKVDDLLFGNKCRDSHGGGYGLWPPRPGNNNI